MPCLPLTHCLPPLHLHLHMLSLAKELVSTLSTCILDILLLMPPLLPSSNFGFLFIPQQNYLCDACSQAKAHVLPHPPLSSTLIMFFQLLFLDVWGPSPVYLQTSLVFIYLLLMIALDIFGYFLNLNLMCLNSFLLFFNM